MCDVYMHVRRSMLNIPMQGVHVSYKEQGQNSKQSGHRNVTYVTIISKIQSRVCYILLVNKQTYSSQTFDNTIRLKCSFHQSTAGKMLHLSIHILRAVEK